MGTACEADDTAHVPLADTVHQFQMFGHSAPFRQAYHFFAFTSLSMRLSRVKLATIFFSSVFSCSRPFNQRTFEISMPRTSVDIGKSFVRMCCISVSLH